MRRLLATVLLSVYHKKFEIIEALLSILHLENEAIYISGFCPCIVRIDAFDRLLLEPALKLLKKLL